MDIHMKMSSENPDLSKYFKKNSSRHHYIPQFLINGFADAKGLLYVYDKQKDQILKSPRPPKAIFFETDRNTLELDSATRTSILEDVLYKEMDDRTSKIIKRYQTEKLANIQFDIEETGTFLFFLISLFWRIPKTDYAAENLMDYSPIIADGIAPESLRADPVFRKLNRAKLFKHHIDEVRKFGPKGSKWHNIHQIGDPVYYVLGDYPILFRKQTRIFSEFNDTDILFAISSNRIYSSTNERLNEYPVQNSWRYNACIIDQSIRYVACGNFKALEYSILFFKKLKETGLIHVLQEETFKI